MNAPKSKYETICDNAHAALIARVAAQPIGRVCTNCRLHAGINVLCKGHGSMCPYKECECSYCARKKLPQGSPTVPDERHNSSPVASAVQPAVEPLTATVAQATHAVQPETTVDPAPQPATSSEDQLDLAADIAVAIRLVYEV